MGKKTALKQLKNATHTNSNIHVFHTYDVAPDLHQPPYLKVYMLDENMDYKAFTIKEYAAKKKQF